MRRAPSPIRPDLDGAYEKTDAQTKAPLSRSFPSRDEPRRMECCTEGGLFAALRQRER
jgi:hypothetical protein